MDIEQRDDEKLEGSRTLVSKKNEKLIEVISEAGLQQMQREPTSGQNLLDLFCCNKPSLVKACSSILGISDPQYCSR